MPSSCHAHVILLDISILRLAFRYMITYAGPIGRAVEGVGLRALAC